MDRSPLVSIGIPVFNEEQFLEETLDSLLDQTYKNIEIIISDNASTDKTPDICQKYLERDTRIRYYRNPVNVFSINNFNFVFSYATGEYFLWAAGHDLRDPTFIEKCVEMLNDDSAIVLCYSKGYFIDLYGNRLTELPGNFDTRGYSMQRRIKTMIWPPYAYLIYGVIRSATLRQTELAKPVLGPDNVLLLELSCLGSFCQIDEHLMFMRKLSDFFDLNSYWMKCFNRPISLFSYIENYFRMIFQFIHVTNKHVKGIENHGKVTGTIFFWFLTRGSVILVGACLRYLARKPKPTFRR
jgi:glycosyltransferase involved in cell wall biosynthesis